MAHGQCIMKEPRASSPSGSATGVDTTGSLASSVAVVPPISLHAPPPTHTPGGLLFSERKAFRRTSHPGSGSPGERKKARPPQENREGPVEQKRPPTTRVPSRNPRGGRPFSQSGSLRLGVLAFGLAAPPQQQGRGNAGTRRRGPPPLLGRGRGRRWRLGRPSWKANVRKRPRRWWSRGPRLGWFGRRRGLGALFQGVMHHPSASRR